MSTPTPVPAPRIPPLNPPPAVVPQPPLIISALNGNNLTTYAGGLIAGAVFYWLGKQGIFAPAGSEATAAGLFAALLGHLAGRFIKGAPKP
jgi:hypothetical protein